MRDFERLAQVVELDSEWMHAVMRTSTPPLYYWTPVTEVVLWNVRAWRAQGHAVCATVDAGPNVHVIALAEDAAWAEAQLRALPGVLEVLKAKPGGGARIIDFSL
jgi:diphosphomevalonate decarboxylase